MYILTGWLIARCLGLIYAIAFASLGVQVLGLMGHDGILPAATLIQYLNEHLGVQRFWALPTLCWFNASDAFLLFLCWGGFACSLLLAVGVVPRIMAFIAWVFYLSLVSVGRDFLGFQWDSLLLEAGFLVIFLTPSAVVIWLLRWLIFRLMLESALVKLISGDPHWRDLTALTYHYWTQPLPNIISWYAAQLPLWFQKLSVVIMFAIELVFPFFIFFGRRARLIAFWGIAGLQFIIMLTGNYCSFNLLALVIALSLLDDAALKRFIPSIWQERIKPKPGKFKRAGVVLQWVLASLIAVITLAQFFMMLMEKWPPAPVMAVMNAASPLRSINSYGLFAMMTTNRMEIVIEGSNDGQIWLPYAFKWKPGDLNEAPKWAAPHQPRLDWQMWFASLGNFRQDPWIINFQQRLLEGSKPVLHLLAHDPFDGHPPKYIRAIGYEYRFTDMAQHKATGQWWQRTYKEAYSPVLTLENFQK